jgi:DNA-binding transcriptional ArsR family regulator
MRKPRKELSDEALDLIAARFRLLAEPMRLRLLHTLGDREMSVSELVEATGAGQANVSKHLGLLADAHIVGRRKEGLNTYYRVTDESIFTLCEDVCSSLGERFASHQQTIKNFKGRR